MTKVCCGTKEGFVCLTSRKWRIRYFERLTSPLIPFTKEGIRCTMISRQPIGGTELRDTLPSMLLFATPLRESRLSINEPLGCCNLCKYPIESGKRPLWISLWDCLGLCLDMISLWVIVDWLTKVAHFKLVKTTYTGPQLAELYMPSIVCFHGVPMRIVSDRETQVISKF
jgi:hypothetical protein